MPVVAFYCINIFALYIGIDILCIPNNKNALNIDIWHFVVGMRFPPEEELPAFSYL